MATLKKKQQAGGKKHMLPVILGMVLAVVLFITLLNVETKMLAEYEEGMVAVAAGPIEENTEITKDNLNQYFTLESRPLNDIPKLAYVRLEDIVGSYVQNDIDEGSMLTKSMLGELQVPKKDTVLLGLNMEALEQSVVGILRTGDTIDIYTVRLNEEEVIEVEQALSGIVVDRSYTSTGVAITKEDTTSVAQYITIPIHKDAVGMLYEALEERRVEIVKHME